MVSVALMNGRFLCFLAGFVLGLLGSSGMVVLVERGREMFLIFGGCMLVIWHEIDEMLWCLG